MDVTRSEFQDLVGAYALDACEPEEAAALDAYVAAHVAGHVVLERRGDQEFDDARRVEPAGCVA